VKRRGKPTRVPALVESSPLRRFDPRVKFAASLCASLAVMLPLDKLAIFLAAYLAVMAAFRLLGPVLRQIWRIRWVLLFLFLGDWWLVGLDLAVLVSLRIAMLAGVFTLFFATTTPGEFGLALESLRLPYRYAFSLSLTFQSLNLLGDEWIAIREAQKSRGALPELRGWKSLLRQVGDLVSLTVPMVVLATRRAWAITEAATARGFDSPRRVAYRRLAMSPADWVFLLCAVTPTLFLWWV